MVAQVGTWGRLAPSLVQMVEEADDIAPNRSTRSDGSIGDPAHAARSSFHNPSGGFVDALDLTHDPANGWDAHRRARDLVARADPRLDHVISNRQAWSADRPYWRTYLGENPHVGHAHIATKRTAAGRTRGKVWWPQSIVTPPTPPPPPSPLSQELDMFFAKQIDTREVFLFEPGAYTHMKSRNDVNEIARAAGISNVEAVIGADTMAALKQGRALRT